MEIYTEGAYLYPIEGKDGRWYWAVGEFNQRTTDVYFSNTLNLPESANSLEELTQNIDT